MYKGKRRRDRSVILTVPMMLAITVIAFMAAYIAAGPVSSAAEPQETEWTMRVEVVYTPEEKAAHEPQESEQAKTYTDEELEQLAIVIYSEAGGDMCSDETRQMVGEVALNRVASHRFPDTLAEVLTQKQQYGTFFWTGLCWPERASKDAEGHAVARAYDCAEGLLSGETERLLPEDVIYQSEYIQGTEIVAESDGFYFCR